MLLEVSVIKKKPKDYKNNKAYCLKKIKLLKISTLKKKPIDIVFQ